jgi:Icc-related predicted phosphoesterase
MKCLLVSDLHYALKQYDWTVAVAPHFDVVVIAGDHLDIAGHVEGGVQIVVILKYLRRLMERTQLVVSSGNHDLDTRDATGEKVARWMGRVRQMGIPADGDSLVHGETLFTICPWWDGPAARQAVFDHIERDAARRKGRWVWVYHAPPQGSPTGWDGYKWYGDTELAALIAAHAPDIVFSGHIHQAPFKQGGSWVDRIGRTWVFNCGQQIGPTPTHIALDTDAGEAVWLSLMGVESVRLDAELTRPVTALDAVPEWLRL